MRKGRRWLPAAVPRFFQACASDRAAARVIFVILSILSILSNAGRARSRCPPGAAMLGASVGPKHGAGVDARRAPRGNPAGRDADTDDQRRGGAVGPRVARTHAEEKRAHEA